MGKEAKIGLAVIGVLAVTLVVVLVMRLGESEPSPMAAVSSNDPGSAPGLPASRPTWAAAGPSPEETSAPIAAVPAPPRSPYGWSAASDDASSSADAGSASASADHPWRQTDPSQANQTGPYGPPPRIAQPDVSDYGPYPPRLTQDPPGVAEQAAPAPPPTGSSRDSTEPTFGPRRPLEMVSGAPRPGEPRYTGLARESLRPGGPRDDQAPYGPSSQDDYRPVYASPKMAYPYDTSGGDAGFGATRPSDSTGPPRVCEIEGAGRQGDGTYVVQPNESFWTISERIYGTGAYFRALAEHNRATHADRDRLSVGEAILAPDRSELERRYPELCPNPKRREAMGHRMAGVSASGSYALGRRTYTVQEGDSLYDIARFELGKGSRWVEIYELNRDVLARDFDYLTPGMKLALPEDSGDQLTTRPGQPPAY